MQAFRAGESNASVTQGLDLSLLRRKAVAMSEALGDCLARLAMTFFGPPINEAIPGEETDTDKVGWQLKAFERPGIRIFRAFNNQFLFVALCLLCTHV